jgi:hypothetical protein
MSLLASFYLIDTSQLDGLRQSAQVVTKKNLFIRKTVDNYPGFLAENAATLKSIAGSGHVFGNLLAFLEEERNMSLMQHEYDEVAKELINKRQTSHFLFTNKQKDNFLNQLSINNYSLDELQKFNKGFSEEGDEETAMLTLEALQILSENLSKIQNDNQVLLLIVA